MEGEREPSAQAQRLAVSGTRRSGVAPFCRRAGLWSCPFPEEEERGREAGRGGSAGKEEGEDGGGGSFTGSVGMEIPAVNLKAIVLVHWLLTIWGCMEPWLPNMYSWSNFTVLALGVWAIAQRDSVDAIFMFLTGLLLTILTDIVHFSLYYQLVKLTDTMRFCTGMAIFSLLLKPLSCFFAYQMYRERGGEYALNLGVFGVSQDTSAYQSIDTPSPPRPYPDVASKGAPPPSY